VPPNDEITNTATEVDATEVSPPASMVRLTPGSKLGRYEIREVIGAGGMGVVYRARDPELNRDVAIKVVGARGRSQDRLLGEARAMAKLDHPALMPVFDVGPIDDGVYVVMPFLPGGTLHDWIHAQPRPWRDVVVRFMKAGRGLAAAHAAGLIHRDFKPRNVMLDGDDVLVADFGLVAGNAVTTDGAPVGSSLLGGTPGYMAPEQARGESIDARADQFSFCVSLWEGLHGERPQEAETRSRGPLTVGSVPTVPSTRASSPRWLREAVARGFAERREDRWPSLVALLDYVDRRSKRWPRTAIAAGAVVLVALVGVAMVHAGGGASPCSDGRSQLEAVWGASTRSEIEAAFQATKLDYAAPVFSRVASTLDERTAAWRAARIDTCRAHRSGRENATLHDQRIRCLDRWLSEASGTVSLLRSVKNPSSLDAAAGAVRALSAVDVCADAKSLAAEIAPPPDKQEAVAALETEIQELQTARRADKAPFAELTNRAKSLVERASALEHPPTTMRAMKILGALHRDVLNYRAAQDAFEEMAKLAASIGDDDSVAFAWTEVIYLMGTSGRDPGEAGPIIPVAQAAVARAGNKPVARAKLLTAEAEIIDDREPERSLQLLQAARELLIEQGADKPESDLAPLYLNVTGAVASAHGSARRFDQALAAFRENLAARETYYGTDHPFVSPVHFNIGVTLMRSRRFEDALAAFQRSVQILEKRNEDSVALVQTLDRVAATLVMLDRLDEALAVFQRALDMAARIGPEANAQRLSMLDGKALALANGNRFEESLRIYDAIVAEHEAKSPVPLDAITAHSNRARTLRELGKVDLAIADYRRSLELSANQPRYAATRVNIRVSYGLTLLRAERPEEAIAPLELAVNDTTPGRNEGMQAVGRWLLGRARVESGKDVARGLREVKAGRNEMLAHGADADEIAEVDTWLAKQRR
jgi:eukaryotic-like serine/threonine-protein kinase